MVQLVASAAASAIVTNTVAAQTQDGRARQTGASADAGGGWFSELLAELLQDAQSSQEGSPADSSQPTAADASTAAGQSQDIWKNVSSAGAQSSANGQTSQTDTQPGNPNNWLTAWLAALAQAQQAGQTNPQSTSPQDALAALVQSRSDQSSTPANVQTTDGTQNSGDPSQDASLLAALQSLVAQFAQAGATAQPQASQSTSDSVAASSGATTPSNAQLAALLQTLQTEAAAMAGSTQPGAAADSQQTAQAANTAAANTATNTTQITGQTSTATPAPRAQFSQTSQQALHQFSTPVTQAPPTHSGFGSGSNNAQQGQSGQHGASANAQTNAQTGAQPASNGSPDVASGNAGLPTFLQVAHDQTIAQQNTGTPIAQSSAVNAVAATTPAQSPAQPVVANLQVGPATQTATPDVHSLAVNIATQSQAGAKQFDIRLDPPELGRVDVRLTVDAAGKAQAHLAVDKPQTLELLQKDSGNLARALKDSGVQLSNNGLQFSLKGQGQNGNGSRGSQSRGRSLSVTAVASTVPAAAASSSAYSVSASGVDIRV